MFIMRFTERPYVAYTEEEVRDSFRSSVRLTFSNSHFNPELGADLYNEYLDEYQFSEEAGFDGLMLNEHHNTPTCMGAAMNLEAAILARITKKAEDRPARKPAADLRQSIASGRGTGRDRHDLARTAGLGIRARHRYRELGHQHQSGA